MLKILTTNEVAAATGMPVRRVQELITEGRYGVPRLQVVENGRVRLGMTPETLNKFKVARRTRIA